MSAESYFERRNRLIDEGWVAELPEHLLRCWLVLERHADADGITYPGAETIGQKTGSKRRSVMRHIAQLLALGLLEQVRKPSPGENAQWRVLVPQRVPSRVAHDDPPTCATRVTPDRVPKSGGLEGNVCHKQGHRVPQTGGYVCHPRGTHKGIEGIEGLFPGSKPGSAHPPENKTRKTDPVWDSIVELFFNGTAAGAHLSRIGKLARDFKSLSATSDEIRARLGRLRKAWPKDRWGSAENLIKHWHEFGDGTGGVDPEDISLFERKRAGESIQLPAYKQRLYDAWLPSQQPAEASA